MARENENHSYTFRFKLVYTGLTSSIIINVPNLLSLTWNEFMNRTLSARQHIINEDTFEYDIVVAGQPNAERAPSLIDGIGFLSLLHQNTNNNFSFYIRPKNQSFVYYLRENCPNEGLLHSLSVSDEYEMFMRRNNEGAEADSEDDSPEPTSEPTPEPTPEPTSEPTCENMNVDSNQIPTFYNGMCCVCFENRDLRDHWQCYIPEGANRHGICDNCFNTYRSSSSRAHDCPVCRQPLGTTNYGLIAPPVPPSCVSVNYSLSENITNPPEPEPTALQDFHYGGSGAAGPQDSEGAAGPPESNHQNFLNNYSNWNWSNNTTNYASGPSGPYNNITTSAVYDYINNIHNVPTIEVRNQEIIIRNIPYNEMLDLQRHNPNNNSISGPSNNTLRDSLSNVISTQINNISNNNRLNTNIFNVSFYNTDNNNNPVG
tara:strand:+ start:1636 stop:2922 length:1287 start_codon:yes stop_codon:yes gene_type:complete